MNNTYAAFGRLVTALALCLVLAACLKTPGTGGTQGERLAPCTASGSQFGDEKFDRWPQIYHGTVSQVVESHLGRIGQVSQLPIRCTAKNYASMESPTSALSGLAAQLPAWKGAQQDLSESDVSAVLLEFLRVYECSLNERRHNLSVMLINEQTGGVLTRGEFNDLYAEQNQQIDTELRIARATLERTLELVGGYDRLRPLALDIECLKRSSLDLRNVLGLAAQASACLPRSWDVRGSLDDLPD